MGGFMKRNLFISLIFTLLFCANHFAQSIGFATPQNNGVYASTAYGSTASTIPVGLVYSYSLTWPQGSTIYYIKLIADGTTYMNVEGGHNDILSSYNLSAGTHNWTLELWETPFGGLTASKTASASITLVKKRTSTPACV